MSTNRKSFLFPPRRHDGLHDHLRRLRASPSVRDSPARLSEAPPPLSSSSSPHPQSLHTSTSITRADVGCNPAAPFTVDTWRRHLEPSAAPLQTGSVYGGTNANRRKRRETVFCGVWVNETHTQERCAPEGLRLCLFESSAMTFTNGCGRSAAGGIRTGNRRDQTLDPKFSLKREDWSLFLGSTTNVSKQEKINLKIKVPVLNQEHRNTF